MHQHATEQTHCELDERLIIGAELIDEVDPVTGLRMVCAVIARKRIGEHQERYGDRSSRNETTRPSIRCTLVSAREGTLSQP